MSQQSAKKFVEEIEKNPQIKQQIKECKNQEEVKSLLQERGFEFSEKEFREAYKMSKGKELTEKELMEIAGGGGNVISVSTD